MSDTAKIVLEMLEHSSYTVVLSGVGMLGESGYPMLRDDENAYDMEQRYGYSAEELLSSAFLSTRKDQFFDAYRDEILANIDTPPGRGFTDMAKLANMGLFNQIITRRVYDLPRRAGCPNVINLHGSVYDNYCVHCGKSYPVEYIRASKKVPLCEDCGQVVRPGICLFGEMVNNQVVTYAANEIQKAEVLVVLGTNLKTYLCNQLIQYYGGDKLILINAEKHYSDKFADLVWYSRVDDALDKIIEEKEKNNG